MILVLNFFNKPRKKTDSEGEHTLLFVKKVLFLFMQEAVFLGSSFLFLIGAGVSFGHQRFFRNTTLFIINKVAIPSLIKLLTKKL